MVSDNESSFEPPLDAVVLAELCRELGGAQSAGFQEAVQAYLDGAALYLDLLEEAATMDRPTHRRESASFERFERNILAPGDLSSCLK